MIISLLFLTLFINWIYNLLINSLGMFLVDILKSIYIVIGIYIILTTVIYEFIKKYKIKPIIIFYFCFTFLYWLFIFNPFQRGKEINYFKEFGYKIRDRINLYNTEMGSYPKIIEELYPQYLSETDLKMIKEKVKYKLYDHDDYNELRKNDMYFLPETSDSYTILIYLDILTPYKIIYNSNSDKLTIGDD